MEFQKKIKKIIKRSYLLQDVIFLGGIFFVTSILFLGLFPSKGDVVIEKDFFLYSIMTVPVIVAIYFIVISFRNQGGSKSFFLNEGIQNKLTVSILFVAILPTIPIIFISNKFINESLSRIISPHTIAALTEANKMVKDENKSDFRQIAMELKAINFVFPRENILKMNKIYLRNMVNFYHTKNLTVRIFKKKQRNGKLYLLPLEKKKYDIFVQLLTFYNSINIKNNFRIDKVNIEKNDYICGAKKYGNYLLVLIKKNSLLRKKRQLLLIDAKNDYLKLEHFKYYLKNGAGVFLFILFILIFLLSITVSIFLARTITKPILTLSKAATRVAKGDFDIQLVPSSNDEIGQLFYSFNEMVRDLEQNRDLIFQKQRLEAWKDMAQKLVHEIKNPLTPISLSAERMKKRFLENHPKKDSIVISSSDMIIEEVNVLKNMLKEFTNFARLPEFNPSLCDLKKLIESTVKIFEGNEKIVFTLDFNSLDLVYIDKVLMRLVFINLIKNSIDAIDGKGTMTIKAFLRENKDAEDKFIDIIFSDDGSGISEENLVKIFEPGFTNKKTGSGLGLSIVKKIILEHNGDISCSSNGKNETTFSIKIPLVIV